VIFGALEAARQEATELVNNPEFMYDPKYLQLRQSLNLENQSEQNFN